MGVQVTFDPAAWQAAFPEFAALTTPQIMLYYGMALTFQRNDGTGPINDANLALTGLNLLVAHLATLFAQSQGDAQPGAPKDANTPVGRISSAQQGSVHVQVELPSNMSQQSAFFAQTKYGLMWWQMTAIYRTARFVRGPAVGGTYPVRGVPATPWPGGVY